MFYFFKPIALFHIYCRNNTAFPQLQSSPMPRAGVIPLSHNIDGFSKAHGNRLWSSSGHLHDERDNKKKVQGRSHLFFFWSACHNSTFHPKACVLIGMFPSPHTFSTTPAVGIPTTEEVLVPLLAPCC